MRKEIVFNPRERKPSLAEKLIFWREIQRFRIRFPVQDEMDFEDEDLFMEAARSLRDKEMQIYRENKESEREHDFYSGKEIIDKFEKDFRNYLDNERNH